MLDEIINYVQSLQNQVEVVINQQILELMSILVVFHRSESIELFSSFCR